MKFSRTAITALIGTTLVGLAACGSGEGSSGSQQFSVATSGASSSPFLIGAEFSNTINADTDYQLSSQATGGFNENPGLVATGDATFGLGLDTDLRNAYEGEAPFEEPLDQLRRMFTVSTSTYHVVTTDGSGIVAMADLAGNKVNLGAPGQSTRSMNEDILTAAGVDVSAINDFGLPTSESFSALQDGVIDATGNFYSQGFSGLTEFASTNDAALVPINDDEFDAINESFGGILLRTTVPADTYKGIEETDSFSLAVTLYTHADMDDDVVYEITRAYYEKLDTLRDNPLFAGAEEDVLRADTGVPEHPGAVRFFEEVGVK